jgi:GNAT superfamily N-acetyltransferase
LERLAKRQRRKAFSSGQSRVDDWLAHRALQHQNKHLSATKVLLDSGGDIAGYYTLATGQVAFDELPADVAKKLPHRMLPVAVLTWLGAAVGRQGQGQGLGSRLLAQALADCHAAGQSFPFIAVILDCVDKQSKRFYQQFDFAEMPGHPWRMFLSAAKLNAMMQR